jgi:hypothetical protein
MAGQVDMAELKYVFLQLLVVHVVGTHKNEN